MTPKFLATITNYKFVYKNVKQVKARIKKLNDCEVYVSIVKKTKSRSNRQNRYYWGVVLKTLAWEIGELEEDMDVIIRDKFLSTHIPTIHEGLKSKFLTNRSKKFAVPGSTSDLTTIEFEEFLTKVRNWSSIEMNIYIPLPNEVEF